MNGFPKPLYPLEKKLPDCETVFLSRLNPRSLKKYGNPYGIPCIPKFPGLRAIFLSAFPSGAGQWPIGTIRFFDRIFPITVTG
jgi:hypothetical protein